jgi:D-alanyl-D-alanine carboxypeptidase (penicillin-binding protein 5/6)
VIQSFLRTTLLIVLAMLACAPAMAAPSRSSGHLRPPMLYAASAILVDTRTGAVLFERTPDVRRPPASTTKILTAMLVLERGLKPDELVPISRRASEEREGAAIGLEVGERWRVEDLLHAMMMFSANDAAVALAEAAAGSVEDFVTLMNQRAQALGARKTTFVVPHGLHHPGHLSTARDLSIITRYAMLNPNFAQIVRMRTWTMRRPGKRPLMLINRNSLLWRFRGADGVKTGWIAESGPCLVASANRGGRRMVAVVMNSRDVFGDASRLLEYGFNRSEKGGDGGRGG